MKLNLGPFTAAEIGLGIKPKTGLECLGYFSIENCVPLGIVRCTGAAAGAFTSAGGAGIPVLSPTGAAAVGRQIACRVVGAGARGGAGGAMTVRFDVVMDDDEVDTATATFTVPTWATIGANVFGYGTCRDLVPDTIGNVNKKIKTITGLDAVTNQTAGNQFQLFTTPNEADFYEIVGLTDKGGAMDGPSQVSIADRYDPQRWTKLGRGTLKELSLGFRDMGAVDQMNRFNGMEGTLRYDILKEDQVIWERKLFTGFRPMIDSTMSEGDEEVVATASGIFSDALFGYGLAAV